MSGRVGFATSKFPVTALPPLRASTSCAGRAQPDPPDSRRARRIDKIVTVVEASAITVLIEVLTCVSVTSTFSLRGKGLDPHARRRTAARKP
jgi:hypothetical protein